MDLNSPETWRWLWMVMALVFLVGEIVTPATFFFLPFSIGAVVAGVTAFAGFPVELSWAIFLAVSLVTFAGLWPLGRRLERADSAQEGVGATRWVGQEATVTETIPEGGIGAVRLERELWRAESLTGARIRARSTVVITRMTGTRLIVVPIDEPAELDNIERGDSKYDNAKYDNAEHRNEVQALGPPSTTFNSESAQGA